MDPRCHIASTLAKRAPLQYRRGAQTVKKTFGRLLIADKPLRFVHGEGRLQKTEFSRNSERLPDKWNAFFGAHVIKK